MMKYVSSADVLALLRRPPSGGPLVLSNDTTPELTPPRPTAGWQLRAEERVILRQGCPDGVLVLFPDGDGKVRCFTSLEASDQAIRKWQRSASERHAVRDLPSWEPEPEVVVTEAPLPPWRV